MKRIAKVLTKAELKKLKLVELDILREVDRVCRKNNIQYSVAYGTLLGAIRHGGFIPWDDDVDIMMLRKDYDKFVDLIEVELRDEFMWVDAEKDRYYGHMFGKVMACNTVMLEKSQNQKRGFHGVFVDVLPFDYVDEDNSISNKQAKKAHFIEKMIRCQSGYYFDQKGIKAIEYRIRRVLLQLVSRKFLLMQYKKNICKNKTNVVKCLSWNKSFSAELFDDYQDIHFEGEKVKCICGYDEYLKEIYGNYMKWPPKEEQVSHHFVTVLELDEYFAKQNSI